MNKNILLASAALSVVPTLVAAKAPGKRVQPRHKPEHPAQIGDFRAQE